MTTSPDQLRLLVVDDDDVFRERLARAFRTRGFVVDTADGPDLAIATAKTHRIDLAVVDLRMPKGSGLEVVPTLVELQRGIRILVLTGYGSIATAVQASHMGAVAYLSKPADADDILQALTHSGPLSDGDTLPPQETSTPSLARVEWEHINRVMADCDGNLSEAARRLGLHRRSLQRKLQKYPPKR